MLPRANSIMTGPRPRDSLVSLLAVLPDRDQARTIVASVRDWDPLLASAVEHGVAHVVLHGLASASLLPERATGVAKKLLAVQALESELLVRALTRSLEALDSAALRAVVLKGPLLGERLYGSSAARPSIDIDLLVDVRELDRACAALSTVGYRRPSPVEHHAGQEHQHIVLVHDTYPILELHFEAYVGFGTRIPTAPLLSRAVVWRSRTGLRARVLAPGDELAYLAVHAAAHRHSRLGWLYDLKLLLSQMTTDEIRSAAARARAWGYARVLAFTASSLSELRFVPTKTVEPLGRLGSARRWLVGNVVSEPDGSVARSATRFVFTAALCDDVDASARYASAASLSYVRRIAGLDG